MIKKEVMDTLINNIELGMSITDSCILSGISRETYYIWLKDPVKKELLEQAGLKSKKRCLTLIQNAGRVSWQANAWLLERRFSDEYGLKTTTKLTGDSDKPLQFNLKIVK